MDRQLTREELEVVLYLAVHARAGNADLNEAACGSLEREGLIELDGGQWHLRAQGWLAYRDRVEPLPE